MTRVEKYHRYRQEIENMRFDSFSSKKEATQKLGSLGSEDVEYEKVMGIHNMYETEPRKKKRRKLYINRFQMSYCFIAIFTIAIILIGLILVANSIWG